MPSTSLIEDTVVLEEAVKETRISKDEGIPLNKLQTLQADDIDGSCSIVDGKWKCD